MSIAAYADDGALERDIADVAERCLRRSGHERRVPLDRDTPLALLGLDSLAAIELAVALEERLGIDVPPDVLFDCPDLRSLALRLGADTGQTPARNEQLDQMIADAALPDAIRPVGPAPVHTGLTEARSVLITGANGFLGAWLVRTLLKESQATLHCLVRPTASEDARTRLMTALRAAGSTLDDSRICIVTGDLREPNLGLSDADFDVTARSLDAICHAGAAVNWVGSYASLRASNVSGTMELLRLACRHRPLPFHFVSSLSVCYSSSAPPTVDETFDALPHLDGVHLGYAQTKVVAESLVREAGRRGLPVAIYRPALISGDSRSGAFNPDDVLAALIKGCVQMGTAPELDWSLDCLPVDIVAAAIVRLSRGAGGAFHLCHPRPRHWRECVLWMRLYGYPVRLVSYHTWLRQLEQETGATSSCGHALGALRSFFLDRPARANGLTRPELYEESRRTHADGVLTLNAMSAAGVVCPQLDATLLDRYFGAYVEAGHLPVVPGRAEALRYEVDDGDNGTVPGRAETLCDEVGGAGKSAAPREPGASLDLRSAALQGCLTAPEPVGHDHILSTACGGTVRSAVLISCGSDHSIVSELASWRSGQASGLFSYRLDLSVEGMSRTRDVVVKVKPEDRRVIEVGQAVAGVCGDAVGNAYARWAHQIGLAGCHERELAIYTQNDPRFTRHAPERLGAHVDESAGLWTVVLERVTDGVAMNAVDQPRAWSRPRIAHALDGLAALQAIWFDREDVLTQTSWIGHVASAASMAEMSDLWVALAGHAAPSFSAWADPAIGSIQRRLIANIGAWWTDMQLVPRTLIHHDFNPRNICLRGVGPDRRLCAYDWELATLGAPQHDLAELLCFVLSPDATGEEIEFWSEWHRRALARETGRTIDAADWKRGVTASVCDLLVNRLAMYALVHRVKPQSFLPRVVCTWRRIYEHVRTA